MDVSHNMTTDNSEKNVRPKIMFMNHTSQLGGAELSLYDLITNLPVNSILLTMEAGPLITKLVSANIEIHVLEEGHTLTAPGYKISFLQRIIELYRLPKIIVRLIRLAKENDLIYANSKKILFLAILTAALAKKPLIWHQRDPILNFSHINLREKLSESLIIWLLNRYAKKIISVSRATTNTFVAAGGKKDLSITVYNGMDPGKLKDLKSSEKTRVAIGLPTQNILVGNFGRLTPWKGQKTVIEALQFLDSNIHCVFVGASLFNENNYATHLKELTHKLGLADRVHFIGFRNNAIEIMWAMDIVVHSSTEFDPCPRVIMEALFSQTPLIATNVGGVPELILNKISGLLIEPGNPQKMAEAIQAIVTNKPLANKLSRNGYELALKKYQLRTVIDKVNSEINKTLTNYYK